MVRYLLLTGMSCANPKRLSCVLSLFAAALLAACAPLPPQTHRPLQQETKPLVYPAPPDAPRFVYERSLRGSADVEPLRRSTAFRLLLTGQPYTSQEMAKPYSVAAHRGRVFVSDTVARVVHVFDVPGQRYFRIGEEEDARLIKPIGLTVDAAGNLYVADVSTQDIKVYDRDGRLLRKLGGPAVFARLVSVAVEADGRRLYAVDIGGVRSAEHRVRLFDAVSGAHLSDIGRRGSGAGEFNLPRDTAVGADGRLYVSDGGNFRVQAFDRDGRYLFNFGQIGLQFGHFARPKDIATDRAGNVYVVDAAFGNVQIFDPAGKLLMFIGERGEEDAPGRYMLPSGVFVDEDGRLYLVDQWFRRVDVFRPAGLAPDAGFLVQRSGEK
jgi:sugar lactone lactonase YvrE